MSPSVAAQLAEIAREYRKAFDDVQEVLQRTDTGKVPGWVFAIDRFDVKDLAEMSKELARVEQRRRQWRSALHAMSELMALHEDEIPVPAPSASDTYDPETSLEEMVSNPPDPSSLPALDRFISVVQYARTVGVMYVDGTFQPVLKSRR